MRTDKQEYGGGHETSGWACYFGSSLIAAPLSTAYAADMAVTGAAPSRGRAVQLDRVLYRRKCRRGLGQGQRLVG